MARKKVQELDEDNIEQPGMGHNSLSPKELKSIIERVETLMEEKKGIGDDIKDIMAEAKSKGFDTRTIRDVIKIRALDPTVRSEREELLDLYLNALGLL